MTIGPGESSQTNQQSPKEQLISIHQYYETSSKLLPSLYLSPSSYQALEKLHEKFELKREDNSEWNPITLAQQIASLDSSIRIYQLPSKEVLQSYSNELKQTLEFITYVGRAKEAIEQIIENNRVNNLDTRPDLLERVEQLGSLQIELDSAREEIERILQELETSELIIGLDEWDEAAIQEDLIPEVDAILASRDQAEFMRGRTMTSFGLEPIYDEKLNLINRLGQSLANYTNTEDADYSRLQDERTSLIRQLNEAIHTQHSRLICQWLELNRNTQISTSETELMASGVDSQYKLIQDNSARLAKELVRQLADLERLSIYVNNLDSKHSQETEDTKATKYGLSQKTTNTITIISEKNPDCDPYEVSRLALVLDEQENDNIHDLEDYKDRYHQAVAEALNQVRSLMVKVFLSLQQLEANIRDLNTKIIECNQDTDQATLSGLKLAKVLELKEKEDLHNQYQALIRAKAELNQKLAMLTNT